MVDNEDEQDEKRAHYSLPTGAQWADMCLAGGLRFGG